MSDLWIVLLSEFIMSKRPDEDNKVFETLFQNIISSCLIHKNQTVIWDAFSMIMKHSKLTHFIIENVLKIRKNEIDIHITYQILNNFNELYSDMKIETRNFFSYEDRFLIEISNAIQNSIEYKVDRKDNLIYINIRTIKSESKYTIQLDDFLLILKLLMTKVNIFIQMFNILLEYEDILIKIFQYLIDESFLEYIRIFESSLSFYRKNNLFYVSFSNKQRYVIDLTNTHVSIMYLICGLTGNV
jgi:hypothetical protein